jgi:hypothetical protein
MSSGPPIQFHCTSCGKPIEIDEEWAGHSVTCPFCQKEVTAPTPNLQQEPLGGGVDSSERRAVSSAEYSSTYPDSQVRLPNPYGLWGLILSLVSVAAILAGLALFANFFLPLMAEPIESLQEELESAASDSEKQEITRSKQREIVEEFQRMVENGEVPASSIVLAYGGIIGGMGLAVVGLILSIVGVTRRNARKGAAIAGLLISSALTICTCCTGFMSFSMISGI